MSHLSTRDTYEGAEYLDSAPMPHFSPSTLQPSQSPSFLGKHTYSRSLTIRVFSPQRSNRKDKDTSNSSVSSSGPLSPPPIYQNQITQPAKKICGIETGSLDVLQVAHHPQTSKLRDDCNSGIPGGKNLPADQNQSSSLHPSGRKSAMPMTPSEVSALCGPYPMSNRLVAEMRPISCHEKDLPPIPSLKDFETEIGEPPNGGLLPWLQVLSGFFCILNAQGVNMSWGVFQAYYEEVMLPDSSPSKIAWIGSVQIFCIFFSGLVVGPLVNSGHFNACFRGGSLLLLAGLIMTSFCTDWTQIFLIQGLWTGISMGMVFSANVINMTTYFSTRLGLVSGLAAAGASTGGIIFPIVAKELMGRIGFGWTLRAFALINLMTMVPMNIITRPRPGWKPAGTPGFDRTMFRDTAYMLMSAGMFFAYEGVYFGFYFIITYGQSQLGISQSSAVNLLISMNIANLFGRFLPNLISDACIGPLNTLIPTAFISACLMFLWMGVSTVPALYMLACLYGFSSAGIQSLYSAVIYTFVGEDISKRGVRMGFVFALIGIACLTGAPLGGQLIKINDGKYLYAQMFAATSLALGGCLFLASRWVKGGWSASRM